MEVCFILRIAEALLSDTALELALIAITLSPSLLVALTNVGCVPAL